MTSTEECSPADLGADPEIDTIGKDDEIRGLEPWNALERSSLMG